MNKVLLLTALLGFGSFVIGFVLNYWISKRRFYRRTITGTQVYRSFEHSWSTRFLEGLGRFIAFILIIGGIMVLLGSIIAPSYLK